MSEESGPVNEIILRLANEWMRAGQARDWALLERLVAPEFTMTGAAGVVDRAAWMRNAAERMTLESFDYTEPVITVYGDVVLMRSNWTQKATLDGKPWNGEFLLTDVWVRREDGWQVVARHSTPITGYSVGSTPETTARPAQTG
jgi:ketosteroid isomerase-like protein